MTESHNEPTVRESQVSDTSQAHSATDEQRSALRIRCPHCHHTVDVESGGNLSADIACSTCGSSFNLVDDSNATYTSVAVKSVGHFELIEEIGKGAFGSVWKARDIQLDRIVAVKLPRKESLTREEAELFLREARATAQLRHPNIVAVHEVGRDGDAIYLVSDLIRGVTLEDWLTAKPLSEVEAAALCAKVAQALDHAHDKGVVHRDIKPSNILMNEDGEPFVADFGLARRDAGELTMTVDGKVMGTPQYMSPEQAAGDSHSADRRSDVYSLGVMLYRLLTGELPFRGNSRMMILQILKDEPTSPRKLNNHLSRDLENITLKCLEKSPDARYQTAQHLVDDLLSYCNGEPVSARPIGAAQRLWRWARRNPRIATLTGTTFCLLAAVAVISAWAAVNVGHERDRAEHEAIRARQASRAAETARDDLQNSLTREQAVLRQSEGTIVDMFNLQGLAASNAGRPREAVLWFTNAAHAAANDPVRRQAALVRVDAWSKLAVRPLTGSGGKDDRVRHMQFDPSGRFLVVLTNSGTLQLHEPATGSVVPFPDSPPDVLCLTLNLAGDRLALGCRDGRIQVRSFPDGAVLVDQSQDVAIPSIRFTPSGKFLAVGSMQLQLLNTETGDIVSSPIQHPDYVVTLHVDSSEQWLVTECQDRHVRVFSIQDDQLKAHPDLPALPVAQPRFASMMQSCILKNRYLLSIASSRELVLHDLQTGQEFRRVQLFGDVHYIQIDPTGQNVAICQGFGVDLLRVSDFRLIHSPIQHSNRIVHCAFSHDGRRILTAGIDGESKLWSVPDGENLDADVTHQGEAVGAAMSPDGETFATSQTDGLVRTWRLPLAGKQQRQATIGSSDYFSVSPDSELVAAGGFNLSRHRHHIQLYNTRTGMAQGQEIEIDGFINDTAFSQDSQWLAVLLSAPVAATSEGWSVFQNVMPTAPGRVSVYVRDTGLPLFETITTPSEPVNASFSPDGRSLVVICAAGEGLILNARTGKTRATFREPGRLTVSLNLTKRIVFSPNGQTFATFGFGQGAHLRSADTAQVLHTIADRGLASVAFSADGTLLATASRRGHAGIYSTATGRPAIQQPLDHADWVFRCRFSPDGHYLLTACRDHNARLWNWKDNEIVAAMPHDDEVFDAVFHPSNPYVLTAGRDRTMRIWHLPSGQPLCIPQTSSCAVHQVSVTPDGKTAIWHDSDERLNLLDLNTWNEPAYADWTSDAVKRWGEVISGQQVVGASLAVLSGRQWLDEWQSLSMARNQGVASMSPAQKLRWHRDEAARSQTSESWASVIWHLDHVLQADPDDTASRYRRGFAAYELDHYNAAAADLERCLDDPAQAQDARHYLAHCLIGLNQFGEAIDHLTLLLEDSPADAHFLYMRGLCCERNDQPVEAIRDLDRTYRIRPLKAASSIRSAAIKIRDLAVVSMERADWQAGQQGAACLLYLLQSIPDADRTTTDHFNLACSFSLCARAAGGDATAKNATQIVEFLDQALEELKLSLSDASIDRTRIAADPDLAELRATPAFPEFFAGLR